MSSSQLLMRLIDHYRFRLLLGATLLLVSLSAIMPTDSLGALLLVPMAAAIFLGAIYLSRPFSTIGHIGMVLVVLWLLLILGARFSEDKSGLIALLAVIATIAFATFVVGRVFQALALEETTGSDALAGAVFGYFVLALIWAELFHAVLIWEPGAIAFPEGEAPGKAAVLYFSLVTITTLGYGDVLPMSPVARLLAGLEAALGTLYVAILIGRIVGALTPGPRNPHG